MKFTKLDHSNKKYDEPNANGVLHMNIDDEPSKDNLSLKDIAQMEHVLGVALIETNSLKAGLKKFGDRGENAVTKELQQLHDMETYYTKKQKAEALASLMFLVEKRDGRAKACACADGSKQRRQPDYRKEDDPSPTVNNNSVEITAAIEAHEGRNVATIDIPDAYQHTNTDKKILMLLRVNGPH